MKKLGQTTVPGAATTAENAGERSELALVIACSASERHRAGEVAFFSPGERLFVGRGDAEVEKFAHFVRQQPGEVLAVDPREAVLGGDTLSRRQLEVHSTGDALEVARIGGCRTYFNGQEATRGVLRPGDTVMLRNEVVLLCVSRSRVLPALAQGRELHPFAEPDPYGMVGESPVFWLLRDALERAAHQGIHVLLQGDSGTGKEKAAKSIHSQSSRARGPCIACNAAAIGEGIGAAEFFGNLANYPNHGMPARKGYLGTADRGTLFLDEIGDCPREVQVQLLRVMDAGEYQAVGEAVARRVDVRFVGATNRDDSVFRADFLARFPVRVRLPPLSERREDIPLIARHFLLQEARKPSEHSWVPERLLRKGPDGREEPRFSVRLIDELVRHPLPDNVRGLHRLVRAAVDASPGDEVRWPATAATASAAPVARASGARSREAGTPGVPSREDVLACLEREEGNVARAARRLGMERTAFYRLMDKYGIERKA